MRESIKTINERINEREFNFDKKNKLNRSEKIISTDVLDEIEVGISSERLAEITEDVPVFFYKTQITIHGNFPLLTNQYINGYKLLFQNQNGSVGVRYNAIDGYKKNVLMNAIKYNTETNWRYYHCSSQTLFYMQDRVESKEEAVELSKKYNEIAKTIPNYAKGMVDCYIGNDGWGRTYICMDLHLNIIPETSLDDYIHFFNPACNNKQDLLALIEEDKRKNAILQAEQDKKWEIEKRERADKFLKDVEPFLLSNQLEKVYQSSGIYVLINTDAEYNWNRLKFIKVNKEKGLYCIVKYDGSYSSDFDDTLDYKFHPRKKGVHKISESKNPDRVGYKLNTINFQSIKKLVKGCYYV